MTGRRFSAPNALKLQEALDLREPLEKAIEEIAMGFEQSAEAAGEELFVTTSVVSENAGAIEIHSGETADQELSNKLRDLIEKELIDD